MRHKCLHVVWRPVRVGQCASVAAIYHAFYALPVMRPRPIRRVRDQRVALDICEHVLPAPKSQIVGHSIPRQPMNSAVSARVLYPSRLTSQPFT